MHKDIVGNIKPSTQFNIWHFKKDPSTFKLVDTIEINIKNKDFMKTLGKLKDSHIFSWYLVHNVGTEVEREFKEYKNVNIVKGIIPDTLEQVQTTKIAYLSIDLNNVIPEIAAAEYFWDRMMSGGMILLDDYNFKGFEEQHIAFDKFAKERGTQVLSLPTGQGLIIRP